MRNRVRKTLILIISLALMQSTAGGSGKLLKPVSIDNNQYDPDDRRIVLSGFNSKPSPRNLLKRERENPWSLPKLAAVSETVDTLKILGLRFNFQPEVPDDDSTTGTGQFDLRAAQEFIDENGHEIDPSPHDKKYFEAHFQALSYYYDYVSDGRLVIEWDVFPEEDSGAYVLPYPMRHYGEPHPQIGLTNYFIDCLTFVDTADQNVDFSEYDSYFLFHAGADRQNDIYPDAFPPSGDTPFDLFTGYIFLIDSALGLDKVYDDSGVVIDSTPVIDALIMPEQASQDNRSTAMNSAIAHEFGHQLGLVDLYRTDNFFTRLGDFALMDNNGHGTGIDFGFEVGRSFGVVPVYPMAWSRAFLGFEEPVIYRQGTDIAVAAAEMQTAGTRVAKIPISEYEYYLLENRQIELDGRTTFIWADSATGVVMGPSDTFKVLTGEYDILLPGSGILIFKVDEIVAFMDYDGDGLINFIDNQLQNNPDRPFIKLIEADGLVNFGSNYWSGYGRAEDMYYEGNNNSFTPNTNPPAIGYGGTNTHVYIDNISASGLTMTFDVEHGFNSQGFPQRAGVPEFGLSPIAADIDGDNSSEVIIASGRNLLVINENGADFTPTDDQKYYDTSFILDLSRTYPTYEVPLFYRTSNTITAGPVVGDFGLDNDSQYIAIAAGPWLHVFEPYDADLDGLGEHRFSADSINLQWDIVWLSFDDNRILGATMDTITESIRFFFVLENGAFGPLSLEIFNERELHGGARIGDGVAFIAGDATNGINLYYIDSDGSTASFDLGGYFNLGPIVVDLDRDSYPEVIVASEAGIIKAVTVDNALENPFTLYGTVALDDSIYVNPIVSDIDRNGYADIIVAGTNKIYALDRNFVNLNNFPLTIDMAFPHDFIIAPPVIGDINYDGIKDIVVLTSAGHCYAISSSFSMNDALHYGFPIAAGGIGIGSPLLYEKQNGGGLGLLGIDGWFYSYDVGFDSALLDWPMGGGGFDASYNFPDSRLEPPKISADKLPEDKFFFYPNPTLDGRLRFRFYLEENAQVRMTLYDMSGKRVEEQTFDGSGSSLTDEEWDLSMLPSGVYRCILQADFAGGEKSSIFTDVAIVR